ncbi:MAG TPA: leucyl/phenylalanyl-tRNA--protein transferase, partial [bacterium]|nr:leucyl/phenylalanyl-tRNA--protein transferase [bacterium]
IGGDLEVSSLKLAYENGVFPWPTEDYPLLWFAPPQRAVLKFSDLRVPKRMRRELSGKEFYFDVDRNFESVIVHCAASLTRKSIGTWITPWIVEAYLRFHQAGFAHSFECYDSDGDLVGGLYGVAMGGMFAGESMFFLSSGASKATLLYAVETLQARGARWMDIQMMTPLLQRMGAREIPREEFMALLGSALAAPPLFP